MPTREANNVRLRRVMDCQFGSMAVRFVAPRLRWCPARTLANFWDGTPIIPFARATMELHEIWDR